MFSIKGAYASEWLKTLQDVIEKNLKMTIPAIL